MSGAELTSVAYKKGNWLRYTLWALAAVCIGVLIYFFVNTLREATASSVPEGYAFAATDGHGSDGKLRTTYYVYDDKILVEDETFKENSVDRIIIIYENIGTDSLSYNFDDTIEICEADNCYNRPRVITKIQKLLAGKIGREYTGF